MAPLKVKFANDGIGSNEVVITPASEHAYHGPHAGDIHDLPLGLDQLDINSNPSPDNVFGNRARSVHGSSTPATALEDVEQKSVGLTLIEDLYGTGENQTFHEYTLSVSDYVRLMYAGGNEPSTYEPIESRHVLAPGTTKIPEYLVTRRVLVQEGYPFAYWNGTFHIPGALEQIMIDQLVDATSQTRARDLHPVGDGPRLVSFTVVVTHDSDHAGSESLGSMFRRTLTVGSVSTLRGLYDQMLKESGAKDTIDNPEYWRSPSSRSTRSGSRSASKSDFYTSKSEFSRSSYKTATMGPGYHPEVRIKRLHHDNKYAQMLQSQRLWPVDPNFEQDWSGRGQHTEFTKNERRLVDDILEVQEQLGLTKHALVQSVKCRRILLARKTIFCTRKFTKEQAVQEVAHITRLGHAHVVRIIGTYVLGKELSILLYPVAQYDLRDYLDIIINASEAEAKWYTMVYATRRFFSCLVSAVHHIHARLTKHMDIKPQNILIQKRLKMHSLRKEYPFDFSVCIADFGISRSYDRVEAIETDGRTAFTPKYAAPEVAEQELRGLKADIFSLGCVFLEVYSVLHDADFKWQVHEAVPLSRSAYQSLRAMRGSNGAQLLATQKMQAVLASNLKHDTSYQANLLTLFEAQHKIWHRDPVSAVRYIIVRMMSIDPAQRPSAANLRSTFVESSCCIQGPPELVAMTAALEGSDAEGNEDSEEESDHL